MRGWQRAVGIGTSAPAKQPEARNIGQLRASYAELIRQHEAELLRTARRLCNGNSDQAQDLVQDTLIRGYEAYLDGRFEIGTNARAWLFRILTNGYINTHRRSSRWEARVDVATLTANGEAGPEATHAAPADRPDMALLASTLDEPLERALATLSEELRVCVILVDIEGLEYAETAVALGIPIGTVRSRLSRARMQLHRTLYNYAHDRRRI